MRRAPPERFHVFVSYTTREEEVQAIKPIVDRFLDEVLRPVIEATIGEPLAFYDGYTLYRLRGTRLPDRLLRRALVFAIEESEILLAFVSPEYLNSEWCRLEREAMASKAARPWFDIRRIAPIDELADHRAADRRPSWWHRVRGSSRMASWRLLEFTSPGGLLLPIVWKGGAGIVDHVPEFAGCRVFDWTACGQAGEAAERVREHLSRHGSVSPTWVAEAEDLASRCQMKKTAQAIGTILKRRREVYRRSSP